MEQEIQEIWQTMFGLTKVELLAFKQVVGAPSDALTDRKFILDVKDGLTCVFLRLIDSSTELCLCYAKGPTLAAAAANLNSKVQSLAADARAFVQEV